MEQDEDLPSTVTVDYLGLTFDLETDEVTGPNGEEKEFDKELNSHGFEVNIDKYKLDDQIDCIEKKMKFDKIWKHQFLELCGRKTPTKLVFSMNTIFQGLYQFLKL